MSGDGGRASDASFLHGARTTLGHWVPYVLVVVALEAAVVLVGAVVGSEQRSSLIPVVSTDDAVPALDPLSIFLTNGQAAALIVVGTVFVLPAIALVGYNAFLLGATLADAVAGLGPIATLSIVVPHAIFELPAFWLAGAISLRWLHVGWQTAQGGDRRISVGRTVTETMLAILVVVVLLGIGAIIEGTVTKEFAEALS